MSPSNMAELSGHGTIYSDVCHRRMSDPERQDPSTSWMGHFYSASDLGSIAPKGFPSMAATKAFWPGAGTFRTFECLYWRQLDFYETKLSYLENKLYKLDVTEGERIKGQKKCRVPFNKNIFMDCCPGDSDPLYVSGMPEANENMSQDEFTDLREKLFAHIESLSKKHRELVYWLQKVKTFPRVDRETYSRLFTMADEEHELDKEAISHKRAIDEMAYASIDPIELRIQRLWLSTPPWVTKLFQYFRTRNPLHNRNGSQTYNVVGLHIFKVLLKGLVISVIPSLVLLSAGVIYLGNLGRALSFGVVVIFSVFFSVVLILVEKRIGHVVVGIVAYIAVLATFLANVT
ncbi:hypothetical protein GGR58DRAFT_96982 [Xylaria digitata]|nr:hypothetical protein GGR58DRAFT_96982 [Xylaria digitata]